MKCSQHNYLDHKRSHLQVGRHDVMCAYIIIIIIMTMTCHVTSSLYYLAPCRVRPWKTTTSPGWHSQDKMSWSPSSMSWTGTSSNSRPPTSVSTWTFLDDAFSSLSHLYMARCSWVLGLVAPTRSQRSRNAFSPLLQELVGSVLRPSRDNNEWNIQGGKTFQVVRKRQTNIFQKENVSNILTTA